MKITESIIVSGRGKNIHIAPFGVRVDRDKRLLIAPFKPSRSLDNLLAHPYATVNASDDPILFAACLTGRRPSGDGVGKADSVETKKTKRIATGTPAADAGRVLPERFLDRFSLSSGRHDQTMILTAACHITEVEVVDVRDDPVRVEVFCRPIASYQGREWAGFNRARAAVVEACVLLSRLHLIDPADVEGAMERLRVVIEKTAGADEKTAWDWLCDHRHCWNARQNGGIDKR